MRSTTAMLACLVSLGLAGQAGAATTVYDFDQYTASRAGATPAGFDVRFGSADIVRSGDFGITCAGGGGACLALNRANPGQGAVIQTSATFTALAGQLVQLSLDISGSQTGSAPGRITGIFVTDTPNVLLDDFSVSYGGAVLLASPRFPPSLSDVIPVAADQPFRTLLISFRPEANFSFQSQFGGGGVIVDNGRVAIGEAATAAVPEPATWAAFAGGFGLVGAAVRSRRRAARA